MISAGSLKKTQITQQRKDCIGRRAVLLLMLFLLYVTVDSRADENHCADSIEQSQREIRHFILVNYRPLILDIQLASGEYLDALCQLMDADCLSISSFNIFVSNILKDSSNVSDFAKKVSYSMHCK